MTVAADTSTTTEQGPLAGSGLEQIASVYEALADARGIFPRAADDLYLWEIAVLLGVHKTGTSQSGDPYEHLRRRVAGETVEWGAPGPEELASMLDLVGELS